MMKRIALPFLFALTCLTVPMAAQAQRKSPLADAPAIRKRVELRETRFELGVGLGSTLNQTFYHGVLADVRLGFHLNDWLAIAGVFGANVSSISTGLNDQLIATKLDGMGRTPSESDAYGGMNKTAWLAGARLELTPFTGKYSLFGALFAHYDFYLFAGAAFVNLAAAHPEGGVPVCGTNESTSGSCLVSGTKPGGLVGLGFHSFFNNWIALGVELRSVVIQNNPAGRGVAVTGILPSGQPKVSNKDLTWGPEYMAIIGATIFLPSTADISP